jgi:D-lactate dehydrogenase
MQIGFLELEVWEQNYLSEALSEHQLRFDRRALGPDNLASFQDCDVLSVFISSRITNQAMAQTPRLKLISTRSTGVDHIDIAACHQRGISVANVPAYGEYTVAEHTFALILSLSRFVHKSYLHARQGRWDLAKLTGFDLQGKTIGVIGAGKIGLHVIKIARGFSMRVLACDLRQDRFLADLLGFRYAALDELLRESDIVSLHIPYSPENHHLIDRARLAQMKRGALLINTARGSLVDTAALVEALESGQLGGAGLDVLEGEDLIREEKQLLHSEQSVETLRTLLRHHVLVGRDDVVYTPHNAFNSREALQRILVTTVENIQAWARGVSLNRVV